MRSRLIVITVILAGLIALVWYIGLQRRPEQHSASVAPQPSASQPHHPIAVLAAPPTAQQKRSEPCPRDRTDNGMVRLSVRSVSTTKQIGFWTLNPDRRFVIVEVFLEAITDFQLASSAMLWLEEPDGTEHRRSVATGALARPLPSLSPSRGEGVGGEIAFEIGAQTRELTLHYDPFLARTLTLCLTVP
uniref:DUF4352 domain-containing protein n=2 Tax=Candidatus Bipolaricaulota TaxID=67810 RepID=H5STM1_ACEAU|nr:hypothetical protein HGMM_OP4C512 [Candidatus Acetothermum autotrophicum]